MKPNLYVRASLALVAAVTIVAGAVAAGAQTLSRTEPISQASAVGDADGASTSSTSTTSTLDPAAVAEQQAQAEKTANEQAYFKKLEDEAAYFKAVQDQAYFDEMQRQADEAAAAEAAAEAAAVRPAGVPDDSYWDRIAACETGGNWSMSGSRFSGGVGFANTTWNSWGGREFAANAGSATREQQIVVANRVATQGYGNVAPVGYSGWGCARHSVGYP